jgi:hypothetical protein
MSLTQGREEVDTTKCVGSIYNHEAVGNFLWHSHRLKRGLRIEPWGTSPYGGYSKEDWKLGIARQEKN